MIQRYCFTDEAESLAKLDEAGYMVQDFETSEEGYKLPVGDPHFPHNYKGVGFDVIVLGTLSDRSNPINGTDADGNPTVTYPPLTGWHVDIKTNSVPECLEQFLVVPSNPVHCV